jgi:hypothetical protein
MLSKAFIEILTFVDMFGYPLTFKNNQAINYRTKLGGAFTLFTLCFMIYAFLILSKDCFNKTNPIVRENSVYDDKSVIDGDKFFFSIYFADEKYKTLPNPEKYIIFHGVLNNYTDDMETTTIPFVKCDFDRHFNKTKIDKNKLNEKMKNFDDIYCLDIANDFKLMNSGTATPRLSLSIFIIECANRTIDGVDCNL